MTDITFTNDREVDSANSFDAFGKQWGYGPIKGYGMYQIGVVNKEGQLVRPAKYPDNEGLEGHFTKAVLAAETLKQYIASTWNFAEEKALHAAANKRAKEPKEKAIAAS